MKTTISLKKTTFRYKDKDGRFGSEETYVSPIWFSSDMKIHLSYENPDLSFDTDNLDSITKKAITFGILSGVLESTTPNFFIQKDNTINVPSTRLPMNKEDAIALKQRNRNEDLFEKVEKLLNNNVMNIVNIVGGSKVVDGMLPKGEINIKLLKTALSTEEQKDRPRKHVKQAISKRIKALEKIGVVDSDDLILKPGDTISQGAN